jgi:hypothetical protein
MALTSIVSPSATPPVVPRTPPSQPDSMASTQPLARVAASSHLYQPRHDKHVGAIPDAYLGKEEPRGAAPAVVREMLREPRRLQHIWRPPRLERLCPRTTLLAPPPHCRPRLLLGRSWPHRLRQVIRRLSHGLLAGASAYTTRWAETLGAP